MKKYLLLASFVLCVGCQNSGSAGSQSASPTADDRTNQAACSQGIDTHSNLSAAFSGLQLKTECQMSESDFIKIIQDLD